ncbi:MAG: 50S ribosomal protein L3 [Candidatus Sumerlaeota bacterium]
MSIGLIGKKLGMTQIYDEDGAAMAVTLIQAGPCPILQKREPETDGYSALQVGFDPRSEKNVNRPMMGHFKKAGVDPVFCIRELRVDDTGEYEVGQALDVNLFEAGENVDIQGVTKGRGFAGTVKRYRTRRGPTTHGSHYHRRPGSSGASADPSRVFKGKKNPGQMGSVRRTMQNLTVVATDSEKNILVVRGTVPGANNGYLLIRKSVKEKGNKAS